MNSDHLATAVPSEGLKPVAPISVTLPLASKHKLHIVTNKGPGTVQVYGGGCWLGDFSPLKPGEERTYALKRRLSDRA